MLSEAAYSLIDGLTKASVKRLIVMGGASSFEVVSGALLHDSPRFNPAWRPIALAHADLLKIYRTANLDWTYFSPADVIMPGERTGKYHVDFEQLLTDENGKSFISAGGFSVAILDEFKAGCYVRHRVTMAY